jgi:hypothetical protein
MKKTLINLAAALVIAFTSQPSWSQDVYRCVGSNGEVFFKQSPCNAVSFAETRERAARQVETQKSLESVKLRIMKVKREIMDLDRFYDFNKVSLGKSDAAIFKASYDEDREELKQRLIALEAEQTVLVEESFQFVSMTGAYGTR